MARIILHASYHTLYAQTYNEPPISPRSELLPTLSFLFAMFNSPIMQHFLLQGRLLWLFLPAVAMAIHVITPGSTDHSTPAGRRSLNLVSSQTLSQIADHPVTCKEPDGPYQFTNSLNRTFPFNPPLPASDFPPGESVFAFDCDVNLPGGYIWFEVC